jgi:hypothetical protein
MLTLDATVQIPAFVTHVFLKEDAVLLNMHNGQYYQLDEVGARLWGLMREEKSLREGYQVLLDEYEVDSSQLEKDVLELVENLKEQGLVEIIQA